MLNALVFIDGVAFPVSDDFEGIEYLEPVSPDSALSRPFSDAPT